MKDFLNIFIITSPNRCFISSFLFFHVDGPRSDVNETKRSNLNNPRCIGDSGSRDEEAHEGFWVGPGNSTRCCCDSDTLEFTFTQHRHEKVHHSSSRRSGWISIRAVEISTAILSATAGTSIRFPTFIRETPRSAVETAKQLKSNF